MPVYASQHIEPGHPGGYTEIRTYPDLVKYLDEQGRPHRTDGPAVEFNNGSRIYYVHGVLGRNDGPAIIHANGYTEYVPLLHAV